MISPSRFARAVSGLALAAGMIFGLASCQRWQGQWVQVTVENQTGQPIHQLEVDYPSASFGANGLAIGASAHYRIQILGSGPVKVDYTAGSGKAAHAQGLTLAEHQQGTLLVRLLPLGKVEFVPNLQPAS